MRIGQLKLISVNCVQSNVTLSGNIYSQNGGIDGAVDYLNSLCDRYADGTYTSNGRCVNADDVNVISGYNPKNIDEDDPYQTRNGTIFIDNVTSFMYGEQITYTYNSTSKKLNYTNNIQTGVSNVNSMILHNSETNITNSVKAITTYYNYSFIAKGAKLSSDSFAYRSLIKDYSYWLSSSCIWCTNIGINNLIRYVNKGGRSRRSHTLV